MLEKSEILGMTKDKAIWGIGFVIVAICYF